MKELIKIQTDLNCPKNQFNSFGKYKYRSCEDILEGLKPHLKENKDKVYPNTPSGMPGVQTLMPVMLNHINDGKLTLNQLMHFVCENPVKIFGIKNSSIIKKHILGNFIVGNKVKKISKLRVKSAKLQIHIVFFFKKLM